MAKLSKKEQETIISFNRGEKTAVVYTADKKIQAKLEAKGLKAIEKEVGGNTYLLPSKKMVRIVVRKAKKYTEAEKEEIRERLAAGKEAKEKLAAKKGKKPVKAAKPAKEEVEVEEDGIEEEAPKTKKAIKKAEVKKPVKKAKKADEDEDFELDDEEE